jgi:hypothetical protein
MLDFRGFAEKSTHWEINGYEKGIGRAIGSEVFLPLSLL